MRENKNIDSVTTPEPAVVARVEAADVKHKGSKQKTPKKQGKAMQFIKRNRFVIAGIALAAAVAVAAVLYFVAKDNEPTAPQSAVAAEYAARLPELKEAARQKTDDPEARKNYAVALYATGDKKGAEKEYKAAAKLNDKDAVIQNNLGNAYRDNGKTKDAIEAYKKSIELNKNGVNAYVNLANIQLYTNNDTDAAIETYKQGLKALPKNNDLEILLGIAYEAKDDKKGAESAYNNILSRDKDNAAAKAGLERVGK